MLDFFILISALLASFCFAKSSDYQEKFFALAELLTKLTSAVETTLSNEYVDQNMSDKALLKLATSHDPSLLEPFREYQVKILHDNGHAIVLVCTKDGKSALFEDAGCSEEMDYNRWIPKEVSPCVFTLAGVCKGEYF